MTSLITWVRLGTLLVLGANAIRDHRTRRVPRRPWYLLLAIAFILLLTTLITAPSRPAQIRLLLIASVSGGLGLALALPLAFSQRFGTADAFAFLSISLLFPTVPHVQLGGLHFPLTPSPPLFFLSVLSNTLLTLLLYPVWITLLNLVHRRLSPHLFTGRAIHWTNILAESGTLFAPTDTIRATGLDLDALRKYLQWRNTTLAALRESPDVSRSASVSAPTPEAIGDGSAANTTDLTGTPQNSTRSDVHVDGGIQTPPSGDDPWDAQAFITNTETNLYGATPDQLRLALDQLTDPDTDTVWVTPGIPLLLPVVTALVLAIFGGDILHYIFGTVFPL